MSMTESKANAIAHNIRQALLRGAPTFAVVEPELVDVAGDHPWRVDIECGSEEDREELLAWMREETPFLKRWKIARRDGAYLAVDLREEDRARPESPAEKLRRAHEAAEPGPLIRAAREQLGLGRYRMGELLGLPVQHDPDDCRTLESWETGKRVPGWESRKKLRALADHLDEAIQYQWLAHVTAFSYLGSRSDWQGQGGRRRIKMSKKMIDDHGIEVDSLIEASRSGKLHGTPWRVYDIKSAPPEEGDKHAVVDEDLRPELEREGVPYRESMEGLVIEDGSATVERFFVYIEPPEA